MNGRAVHLVQPPYPAIARQAHASGTVGVQVLIDESGEVIAAHAKRTSVAAGGGSCSSKGLKVFGHEIVWRTGARRGVIQYSFVAQ